MQRLHAPNECLRICRAARADAGMGGAAAAAGRQPAPAGKPGGQQRLRRKARDGSPAKRVWALLKPLQPFDANVNAKIDTAMGGIAVKFAGPHERANRG